jgi:hypothetical protein
MNWKYCEEKLNHFIFWRASGQINGHYVELTVIDDHPDWDDGMIWTVKSEYYGIYFSPPGDYYTLSIARNMAEQLFNKLKEQYEGKDDFE